MKDFFKTRMKMYVATKNVHKVSEYERLLARIPVEILSLPANIPEAPETGSSFTENAIQKADFYGAFCDGWVLADDSGLMVDAIGGQPGIFSARYAGIGATDEENNQKLLNALDRVNDEDRSAHFVCAIAVVRGMGARRYVVEAKVPGRILREPRGVHGFGYDSLFYSFSVGKTYAEMDLEEKNLYSHRARAVSQLMSQWEG